MIRTHMNIRYFIMILGLLLIFLIGLFCMKPLLNFLRTESHDLKFKDESGFVDYKKIFLKKTKSFRGSIYIFPPTGGENIVDRLYARDLALKGFEVFILQNWTGYNIDGIDYELHNSFYQLAQEALNKILNLASTNNIGILGTSVGALHTSVALTINPKIKTGFIIVGGLSIPEVIVHSDQPAMVELKEKRYKEFGLKNDEQYLKDLSSAFLIEPTKQIVNHAENKNIGAVISTDDSLVPTKYQENATTFFKASPKYISPLTHVKTVAWYGLFKRKKVINFFDQNL